MNERGGDANGRGAVAEKTSEPPPSKVEALDGSNYKEWSGRMRSAFKRYKLLKIAVGEEKMPEEGEARERWIEKSAVLFDLILQSVNKEMFEHIKDLVEADDSGPRAWKLLRDVIQPNTLPMVIVLEKELAAISMRPGDDVKPVLDKIKDTYARMAAAGSSVSQLQQCTKIISVLDNSWDNLIPTLNSQQDQWTPDGERAQGGAVQGSGAQGEGAQGNAYPGMYLMVEDVHGHEGDVGSVGKVVMHPLTHWVIDSGCTSHMTPRADLLDEVKPPGKIKYVAAASGALLPVIGVGNAKVKGANGELVGLGNFSKFPFNSTTGPAKTPLALVHMDVVGPTRAPSLSGSRYFLTIVDDHTRAVWVYPLKSKGEVAAAVLKEWMPRAQRECGYKVKVIRSDNGKPNVVQAGSVVEQIEEDEIAHCYWAPIPEPKTREEALNGPNGEKWKASEDEEFGSLIENETWDLCDLPPGKKAITSKMIYRHKYGPEGELTRYKSRLVARGFQQTKGKDYDEVFAPVGKGTTLRVLLAIAALLGWKIRQMDIVTAFLNGIILEEVYMKQPEGLDDGSGRVCRLKKAIYGLKQAPRACAEQMLEMQFKCSKMGEAKYYLGMHVERDVEKGVLRLHQRKYLKADGTSIGGYVCLLGGGAVSWRSKKQNEVGLTSCETEYMALHHGAKEVVWLRRLLEELGVGQEEPTVVFCDNESAVKLAKNACLHGLTKHIRPKWHWPEGEIVV
ncbi:hypothetical protein CLOP_g4446 [Closterium sp. NIES-67]|nr:hypothetical protein CLOP_g4446 [Closterium sp. NIES-67]